MNNINKAKANRMVRNEQEFLVKKEKLFALILSQCTLNLRHIVESEPSYYRLVDNFDANGLWQLITNVIARGQSLGVHPFILKREASEKVFIESSASLRTWILA